MAGILLATNVSGVGNITLTKNNMSSHTDDKLEEIQANILLHKMNDEMALRYLPVIVYMLVLMLVGTFGNILVCCVYYSKPTKTSSHYFILTLAVFDLLTCIIGMPTEVTDLRYPYMFYAPVACKILRFIESVSTIGSSIILIAVAFDRYYRICKLGKQVTTKKTKIICIVAVVIGMLTSWPACVLFGQKTIDLGIPEIHAVDCSTDDSMKGTIFPTLYYGFLFMLFFMCLSFFTVIYTKIGRVIWKRKKMKIGESSINSSYKDGSFNESTPSEQVSSDPVSADVSSDAEGYNNWNDARRTSSGSHLAFRKRPSRHEIRVTRTTVVLFAVTVAYVISFLPFLIVMVLRNVLSDFEERLSPEAEVVYKFCSKSYFINNAINPVIYSFLNINFRNDTKNIFKKCITVCCSCENSEV